MEQLQKVAVFSKIPIMEKVPFTKPKLSKEEELLLTSSDEDDEDEEEESYYINA